jgi:hypothetical protein
MIAIDLRTKPFVLICAYVIGLTSHDLQVSLLRIACFHVRLIVLAASALA